MKKRLSILSLTVLAFIPLLASTVHAVDSPTSRRTTTTRGNAPTLDLEELRGALLDLNAVMKELIGLSQDAYATTDLDKTSTQIAQASYEDLRVLRKGIDPATLRQQLATARAAIQQARLELGPQGEQRAAPPVMDTSGFPMVTGFCDLPGGGTFGPSRIPVGVVLAADVVYFIAEGVRDLAQNGCNEVIVILGEGGNGRLLCNISDAVYIVAKAIWTGIHFCDDDLTGNVIDTNYARLAHLHTDLESSVANDNTNRNLIIANDDANRTLIIDNANANKNELRDLILRTQIEADLALDEDDAPVALYVTPAANGGYLDLVMTIVTETIANIQAAGKSTGSAQTYLDEANAAKASGECGEAYELYRKAYGKAVEFPSPDDDE